MGTLKQKYYKVRTWNGSQWTYESSSGWEQLDATIVSCGNDEYVSKISIQAPSGMVVEIDGKQIIIGRSGLYDLDNEDLRIKTVKFLRPKKYVHNSISTEDRSAYVTALDSIYSNLQSVHASANDEYRINFANEVIRTYSITIPSQGSKVYTLDTLARDYLAASAGYTSEQQTGDATDIIINYVVEEVQQ